MSLVQPPPPFHELWEAALVKYEAQTGIDLSTEDAALRLKSLGSPEDVMLVLEDQLAVFTAFRTADGKWRKLRDVLKPVVPIILSLSRVAGDVVSSAFPTGSAVCTGVSVLLEATKGVSSAYDGVIDLFDSLRASLERISIRSAAYTSEQSRELCIKILAELLGVLALATKLLKRKRLQQYARVILGSSDVSEALARLQKLAAEDAALTATETFVATQQVLVQISDLLSLNQKSVEALISVKKLAEESSRVSEYTKIMEWLAPPDPHINHERNLRMTTRGSSAWIARDNSWLTWKNAPSGLLWIQGKPGSGKSVLCSAAIDMLKQEAHARVIFFYFDFRESKKQSTSGLLRSLIHQLVSPAPIECPPLFTLYEACNEGSSRPSVVVLLQALQALLSMHPSTCIILDALDECPIESRRHVLDVVETIAGWDLRSSLHIMVTSRPESDLKACLQPLTSTMIILQDVTEQQKAIGQYVTHVLDNDRDFRFWTAVNRAYALKILVDLANGMFRWVYCQLEVLRRCLPKHVKRSLDALPKTLDETYIRALTAIPDIHSRDAFLIFQFLAFSRRPLYADELVDVLAMEFDSDGRPEYVAAYKLEDAEAAVLSACSSLVIVEANTNVVNFAHFSVKEFFLSSAILATKLPEFRLEAQLAHMAICKVCLGAILYTPSDELSGSDSPSPSLLRYAAVHWMAHARSALPDVVMDAMIQQILNATEPSFQRWLDIHDARLSVSNVRPVRLGQPKRDDQGPDPLFYAALGGLHRHLGLILRHPSTDVNKPFMLNVTALHLAALEGHIDAIRILLDHGADVNALSSRFQAVTPLEAAATGNYLDVARLLVERGAVLTGNNAVAVHSAATHGHINVLRFLLDNGADPNFDWKQEYFNRSYTTPLWAAAENGQLAAARVLLECGGDVNQGDERTPFDYPSGEYGAVPTTPLEVAILGGHDDITRLYFKHGAKLTEVTLLLAVRTQYRSLDIVKLVLSHGADPNPDCAGYRYLSPLAEAADSGDFDLAHLLLAHGADVDYVPDRPGGCMPPVYAAINDKPYSANMVHFLLEHGADANASRGVYPGPTKHSALERARELGRQDVVDVLLGFGAGTQGEI